MNPLQLAFLLVLLCLPLIVCQKKPNIVLILADDQDITLGGFSVMNKTKTLLQNQGVHLRNAFVTSPVCCPSRSSILTGTYIHNHGAHNNSVDGNCSSIAWQQGPETRTHAVYLRSAGYDTYYAGKYLNQYGMPNVGGTAHVPPGWSRWFGLVGNSRYYNYDVSDNGVAVHHGDTYETDYFTDVIKRDGVSWIHKMESKPDTPIFMVLATPAPHEPATPAPQYSNRFVDRVSPRIPSWNYHSEDKHWLIRSQFEMNKTVIDQSDYAFRHRLMTLLSVDDLVSDVVLALEQTNRLDNTYIFYFSDHGYHLGEFCMPFDKRQLYENDIRVPFVVRGPSITKGKTLDQVALSIDLAPTFLDLAGVPIPNTMDGRSLKSVLTGDSVTWRNDFLVEYYGEHNAQGIATCGSPGDGFGVTVCDAKNNTYNCVRSLKPEQDTIYCELEDAENFKEFYDIKNDPFQLKNAIKTADPELIQTLAQKVKQLKICSGPQCNQ